MTLTYRMVDEDKAGALIIDGADSAGILSLARLRKLQPKLTPSVTQDHIQLALSS